MIRIKWIVFILILLGKINAGALNVSAYHAPEKSSGTVVPRIINANDSVIFDLANATLTANYIDIPVYIVSDDIIFSFDYAMMFNLSLLTFSTTIDILPSDSTILSSAYFNPTDLYLRYTSSSLQSYPTSGGIPITKIRFALNATCVPISASDFTNILTILNGSQCANGVTPLNFSKFIPNAGFTAGPVCSNADIQFSDTSSVGSGSITSWSWNFDNGTTSLIQNPLIPYNTAGAASATLIVGASTGCMDTLVAPFFVNEPPAPAFSYSFDCVKDSVFFTNTSTIPSGTITTSLWDFGDTFGTSNAIDPVYQYSASIMYTVTLLSTSDYSCIASASVVVDLTNTVSAIFTTNSINNCLGSAINFNDASTYPLNPINGWLWDFGDGNNSNLQNPTYTYASPGTYSVQLTSISAEGCKDTVSQSLTVYALPQANFGITSVTTCIVANASFTNLSTSSQGSGFFWNFGDGSVSNIASPVYSYSTAGEYSVKVVVTTTAGCTDSLSKKYTVFFPPPAKAVFSHLVLSSAVVSFSNLTVNAIKSEWDFGDSQNASTDNPVHTFSEIGTYRICLTAYDSLDCIYTSCKDVYSGMSRIVAVPSSFTPNDDNINDVLKVRGGPLLEMRFQIFNEWGNLLFSSPSQDIGWDGTFNGEAQPVGVYEYILKCRTADNEKINLYGAVNLTR